MSWEKDEHTEQWIYHFKMKNFPDCMFHFINEWEQLFGQWNWMDWHLVDIYIENDSMLFAYELHVILLGLGFRVRIMKQEGVDYCDKLMERVKTGKTKPYKELFNDKYKDKEKSSDNNKQ